MSFVPVPGGTAGNFAEGQNLANWVDQEFLPLRKWDGDHDPEGLLEHVAGRRQLSDRRVLPDVAARWRRNDWKKVGYLIVAGVVLAALGWTLEHAVPRHQEDLDLVLCVGDLRI